METLTLNLVGRTRRETLAGRSYIVAPLSMLVPGVLNGSKGRLFYPPDEVNKNPSVWNHMPIVVYHPMRNGQPVSARDPEVLNQQGIGYVFRSRENGRAEGWFDVEATKRVDNRVFKSLLLNKPIELSTGLFTRNQKATPGSHYKGKAFDYIARDYVPDHLAVLPDQKGACSLNDGCGVLVNQAKQTLRQINERAVQIINGSPNQPRDARGRWSGGGGGGSAGGGSKSSGGMGGGASKPETSRTITASVLGVDLTSTKVQQYGNATQIKGMGIAQVKPKMEQAGYKHTGSEKADYGVTKHTFVKGSSNVSVHDEGDRVIISHSAKAGAAAGTGGVKESGKKSKAASDEVNKKAAKMFLRRPFRLV